MMIIQHPLQKRSSFKYPLGNEQAKPIPCLWVLHSPHQYKFYEDILFELYATKRKDSSHWIKLLQFHLLLATKYITSVKNSQRPLNSRAIALDYYMFLRGAITGCVDVTEYSAFSKEEVGRE